jgi:hypothetical protein
MDFLDDLIGPHAGRRPIGWDARLWRTGECHYIYIYIFMYVVSCNISFQGECWLNPGIRVPVCFENAISAIVAELPVLKAGTVIVPVDPTQLLAWVEDIVHQTVAKSSPRPRGGRCG